MSLSNGQYRVPGIVAAFLTDDGLPTGVRNFNGDFSITPAAPFWGPPPGLIADINNFEISIAGGATFNQAEYGSVAVLTNGIDITVRLNGVIQDLTPVNIFDNTDLLAFGAGGSQIVDFGGTNDNFVSTLNVLPVLGDGPVRLNGTTGDRFIVNLNDAFDGTGALNFHGFLVRGII